MSRGPVPDKPPGRPTVAEVVELARAYYAKPENELGGALHVVLDDGNLEDSNIHFCCGYAAASDDQDGVDLANKLLAMTRTQRRQVYKSYEQYRHPWPGPLARALGARGA